MKRRFSTCFWERKRGSTKLRGRKLRGRNLLLIILSWRHIREHISREEGSSEKNEKWEPYRSFYLEENLFDKTPTRDIIEQQLFDEISVSKTHFIPENVRSFFSSSLFFLSADNLATFLSARFSCAGRSKKANRSLPLFQSRSTVGFQIRSFPLRSSRRRSVSPHWRTRMTFGCAFARASGSVATPDRRIKHRDFGFT